LDEYNRALQTTINQYTQMLKKKSLSNKEIKQFRLKETTLQNLINQKHIVNFSDDLNFDAGKKHIKFEIKEYKMFQTGDKFDVTKYKNLLRMNNISPTKFEEDMTNQVKTKKLSSLLENIQDSKAYLKQTIRFKNLKMKAIAVSFDKEAMTANLKISSSEIKTFSKDEKNKKLIAGLYKNYEQENKAKKLKVKTLKLMTKNLVTKHLQKTKRKELTAFNKTLKEEIKALVENSNLKKLAKLQKKYDIDFSKKHEFTPFNLRYKDAELNEDEALSLFKDKNTTKVLIIDTPTTVTFAKATQFEDKKVETKDLAEEIKFSAQRNSRLLYNSVLKFKEKNSKVITTANLFQ